MDNKKKQCGKVFFKVFYVLLFSMVLNIFLFTYSVTSYAYTEQEFEHIVNDSINKAEENYNIELPDFSSLTLTSDFTKYNDFLNNLTDYYYFGSFIWTGTTASNMQIYLTFFPFFQEPITLNAYNRYSDNNGKTIRLYFSDNTFLLTDRAEFVYWSNSLDFNLYHDFDYYLQNGTYFESNYEHVDPNSITLTPVKSGSKFSFTDKTQLKVEITGYNISDFSFFVQRLDSNEWNNYTDVNDYLRLANYENPYYIFWRNLNYFPAGTYRYMAQYNGDGSFSTVSSTFEITGNVIDNPVTDTTIDTGETVDNIKDFLGSPADFNTANVTEKDLENAINIKETVNPYDNFLMTFINGLISSLTDTSSKDFTFKVHTWGQTFTVKTTDVIPQYGPELSSFLRTMSCIVFGFILVKWVTQLVESINVGDVGKSLELIEKKYSDLL